MPNITITISDEQDKALEKLATDSERTKTTIIKEQVIYYVKKMLQSEAEIQKLLQTEDTVGLKDNEIAELSAVLLNAKSEYLNSLKL